MRELSREELLVEEREIARENTIQSKQINSERITNSKILLSRREWSKPLSIKQINPAIFTAYFDNYGKATSRHSNEIHKYTKNIDSTK